ncbi:MAG TPA: alkaline phosphatase family protein [Chitinophagales bacterium]|nr:alkaline phosphatase family protein [Chitinophagales bacterium]
MMAISTYSGGKYDLRRAGKLILLLVCTLCVSGVFGQSASVPRPDHIVVLIEENQPFGFVVGNSWAPYINQLAQDTNTAVFTKFYAIEHPSQPDYFDMFAGSNQGVLDDNVPSNYPFTSPNLARQLMDAGFSFKTYSQNLPYVGFDGATSNGYARKHNPVANWVGTGVNQVPDSMNQPFTAYPTWDYSQLPTISYVVPVEDSDMHNGFLGAAITPGDYWFHEHLDDLLHWALTHNTLFIITFDEDDGFAQNNIPTLFYGPMVKGGSYSTTYDLYGLLRTMEDMYGLPYAANAATATTITGCWKTTYTGINSLGKNEPQLRIYPNPVLDVLRVDGSQLDKRAPYELAITDVTGRQVEKITLAGDMQAQVNMEAYPNGLYFYSLMQNAAVMQSGRFVVSH